MPDQTPTKESPAEEGASAEEALPEEAGAGLEEGAEEGGEEEGGMPTPAVFPLDPDWILMLLFAMFVDLVDAVIIILGLLDLWTITGWISLAIDVCVTAIIGGWQFWRIGEIVKTKRQRQEALVKRLEAQASRLKKLGKKSPAVEKALQTAQKQLARFARPLAKVLAKVGVRAGLPLAGETGAGLTAIPVLALIGELIGLIPFWTISVFMMLGERGE